MSRVYLSTDATQYLNNASTLYPDLSVIYKSIFDALSRKLYHQLTVQVLNFVSNDSQNLRPTPDGTNTFFALYNSVILRVYDKINNIALARIASAVSHSVLSLKSEVTNVSIQLGFEGRSLLEDLLKKKQLDTLAKIYVESKLQLLNLRLNSTYSLGKFSLNDTLIMLKKNRTILSEFAEGSDSEVAVVHAAYYECSMTYYKTIGSPESFYKESIQYLRYTSINSLKDSEKCYIATHLCISALTGEGLYNFGEVVYNNSAILESLKGTEKEWLIRLMKASSDGNIDKLNQIWIKYEDEISSHSELLNCSTVIREKTTLLALVNMIFERPSMEWTLSFKDIAARIRANIDDVELIIMRALSLKLIEGVIDEVDEIVNVTCVIPRFLDKGKIMEMGQKFGKWAERVSHARDYFNKHSPTYG